MGRGGLRENRIRKYFYDLCDSWSCLGAGACGCCCGRGVVVADSGICESSIKANRTPSAKGMGISKSKKKSNNTYFNAPLSSGLLQCACPPFRPCFVTSCRHIHQDKFLSAVADAVSSMYTRSTPPPSSLLPLFCHANPWKTLGTPGTLALSSSFLL